MRIEDIFFKYFFYPFFIGIILSSLTVVIFIGVFTNNYTDKITYKNIINLEKKYSEKTISSVNILMTTSFLKIQSNLNEHITQYQHLANKIVNSSKNYTLRSTNLKSIVGLDPNYCYDNIEAFEHKALWLYDKYTDESNVEEIPDLKNQLIVFDNIIQNIDANYETTWINTLDHFFYFERNELYLSYPLSMDCYSGFAYYMTDINYYENTDCIDENGEFYDLYKIKCEGFYQNILKSKTSAFDNNYLSNINRTIFITNYYGSRESEEEYEDDEVTDYSLLDLKKQFTICIGFDDPITKGKGYACSDIINDMVYSLDSLNTNLAGYYFISNVGYNQVFYFPQGPLSPLTSIENIFKWDTSYFLDEKIEFNNNVKKIFSSNYIDNIGTSLYDEIYVNGKNSSGQYFYVNNEKLKYSIYPILLENLLGQKEHILSIIYIYNNDLFINKYKSYTSSAFLKILLEILIFVIFGSGLLYMIYLSFNLLAKYIVIPIKNVNYMLKGINIGGENRLEYLEFLKKKHDENIEKLEKMYLYEAKKNNKDNDVTEDTENDSLNNKDNLEQKENNNSIEAEKNKNINELMYSYSDFQNKFDEDSQYIEQENCFYDFNELHLQYRPLEIQNLVNSLINLKSAVILTSTDGEVEQIINYSFSEEIFRNYKNKQGAVICQSNIGNLQSQLLQFDKAIYHLALSLQDNKLKKFLNRNLSDEFDSNDSLLNSISSLFNSKKKKEKTNILVEKQKNNFKYDFSQKTIGILINTRYCRLIHFYYMFFKNIQKLNDNATKGQFMNTLYHTIDYYHKIVIQYVFLSYAKNDLVKIGESILDYLEFLIKFRFKASSESKYILKINYRDRPEYREKQNLKKKIFNKIINWFNLYDDYVSHVNDNSLLGDEKSIVGDYTQILNKENAELNFESLCAFMFRVNIQRGDFLKGKFALYCQNYNDALFYFIRAAKKETIIIDGLIKKKSLKHIFKLLLKMKKKYESLGIKNAYMEKELKEYKYNKNTKNKKFIRKLFRKNTIRVQKHQDNQKKFGEEIEIIKEYILQDINKYNAKKERDIVVLIDFNIYDKQDEEIFNKSYKIDNFIEQTMAILNNYLTSKDRFAVFIYVNEYQIICPLMSVNKIDTNNFSRDLKYYKKCTFNEDDNELEDDDININFNLNDLQSKDIGNKFANKNFDDNSLDDSSDVNEGEENNYQKISGLIKTINYMNYYLRTKEDVKNDKYAIVFTDIFNLKIPEDEKIEKLFTKLNEEKETILILAGRNKKRNLKNENTSFIDFKKIEKLFLNKFGDKSEIIDYENMKKIKTILSNNNVIKDEIIYPNEIYK